MARSSALLLVLGLLVLVQAVARPRPVCGRGSSPLRRPPLFVVGLRRADSVAGLPGCLGPRLGRTQLGASKRKLPDDPSELQRLVVEKEAELKVAKVQLKERTGKMAAEVRERDERVARKDAEMQALNMALANANTELLRYKHQLTIRSVMEKLERNLCPKKRMQPSLSRRETWLDIFESDPEVEAQVRAVTGAKDTVGAVQAIQDLYKELSHEIHNPDAREVPIPLGLLSHVNAGLAVLMCRRLPVHYRLLSVEGTDLGGSYTPEQVGRGDVGADD